MSKQKVVDTVDRADMVIVGNGIAGLTAAVEARRLEPEKSIVIVTNQSHPTINTPALKQFAVGKLAREQLLAYPAGTERMQRIHLVNAYAEEIHAQEGYLRLSGGQGFGYGSLLLATGSRPTGLPQDVPGQDFDGVMTLHRLYDYLNLRRRLNEVEDVVVIGGGPHAVETVVGLLHWGIRVHWLIRSATFMPRMLDRPASDMVLDTIRRAGAKIYTETEVLGIVGRVGLVAGVVTTQQQMLPCQLVVVCTGTVAVTMLARNCDLPLKYDRGGILVDDQLRTSVHNIYAAGDVAALRDPLTGKYAPRAQWHAAVLQGRAVASAMTGAAEPESFGVPWHATRLGDLSMLTVGNPLAWPESVVPLTERRKGSYCLLSMVDDRLVGYLSLGSAQPDGLAIKRIIDEGLSVREITKDLLRGEFDARKYFSRKRTYTAQRMVTTGQLPTPLPPMPGIIAGESRTAQRPPSIARATPRGGETGVRLNAVQPLASPKEGTATRLNAVQPLASPKEGTATRLNAVQPLASPKEGTATRLNAVQPATMRSTLPARDDEAWINAAPAQSQQAGADVGWMNAAPAFPAKPQQPAEASQRKTDALYQHPAAEPLVRSLPMRAGSRSVTGPRQPVRQTDEQRRKIAEQKTIFSGEIGADTDPRPNKSLAEQKTIFSGEIGAVTDPRPRKVRTEQKAIFSGEIEAVTDPRPNKSLAEQKTIFSGEIGAVTDPRPRRVRTEQKAIFSGEIEAVTDPRPNKSLAEQKTVLNREIGRDTEPRANKQQAEGVDPATNSPARQFIVQPGARTTAQPGKTDNPHPSRSLWHYTDKHPAVGGKKHVQE